MLFDLLRLIVNERRTDGFVRILRACASLVHIGLYRHIALAEPLADIRDRRVLGFLCNTDGVGTNIRNETHRAFPADVDALIKLLGDHHRALCGKAELSCGLLLHTARGERRRGMARLFTRLQLAHCERRTLDAIQHRLCIRFGAELTLFAVLAVILGVKVLFAVLFMQMRGDRPVLFRYEIHDLLLAVADDTRRYRLHAASGQSLLHLCPQDGADLVADEPIKHAARLLCIYEPHVDGTHVLDRGFDSVRRDLVEHNAALARGIEVQNVRQMPGDRFTLAVRVGREIDLVGLLGLLADLFQYLAATA